MKSKEIILDDHVFTYFQDGELFIENPTTEATIHLKAAEVLQLLVLMASSITQVNSKAGK